MNYYYAVALISNAIRILGTRTSRAIAIGSIPVQQNTISVSYRIRGRVARIHTNTNIKNRALIPRITDCRLINDELLKISGIWYPPINRIAVNVDISTILQYSARKKNTKIIPLCSVIKPATSSLSASTRSNGVRFVSARADTKNRIKIGSRGIIYHTVCCDSIISVILKVPHTRITASTQAL